MNTLSFNTRSYYFLFLTLKIAAGQNEEATASMVEETMETERQPRYYLKRIPLCFKLVTLESRKQYVLLRFQNLISTQALYSNN